MAVATVIADGCSPVHVAVGTDVDPDDVPLLVTDGVHRVDLAVLVVGVPAQAGVLHELDVVVALSTQEPGPLGSGHHAEDEVAVGARCRGGTVEVRHQLRLRPQPVLAVAVGPGLLRVLRLIDVVDTDVAGLPPGIGQRLTQSLGGLGVGDATCALDDRRLGVGLLVLLQDADSLLQLVDVCLHVAEALGVGVDLLTQGLQLRVGAGLCVGELLVVVVQLLLDRSGQTVSGALVPAVDAQAGCDQDYHDGKRCEQRHSTGNEEHDQDGREGCPEDHPTTEVEVVHGQPRDRHDRQCADDRSARPHPQRNQRYGEDDEYPDGHGRHFLCLVGGWFSGGAGRAG